MVLKIIAGLVAGGALGYGYHFLMRCVGST
jgi:hypothetical protein